MSESSSWLSVTGIIVTIIVYRVSIAFYRLFLHSLARFPGPKLAAITLCYEAYYDLYLNGQYTFKIAELHKKYGPIIRISPHELHISDPVFFNTLYRQDASYDKYSWTYDAFGVKGGTVATVAHKAHKARRQPLAPFFSQARVASRQDMIRRHITKLRNRLTKLAESSVTFNLGAAATAFTRDISNDYILNKSYNSLDREDFDVVQLNFSQGAGGIWRLAKFVRFVAPMLESLPLGLMMAVADSHTKEFLRHLMDTQEDTRRLMAEATSPSTDAKNLRNLVDEIMDADLPLSEKGFKRIFDDVSTATAAGFETTAAVLRLIFFNVFSNTNLLHQLREELACAGITADGQLEWKVLERLPWLSAVLHEGLRLSPAIATRLARISPHAEITYKEYNIPAGTPVGMSTILMHMDEAIWPEPTRFRPERWLKDGAFRRIDRGFAPFSKGTRICVGLHLAWAEIYLLLADLLLRFDFRFQDASAEDFLAESDQFSIGTRSKGNLKATVAVRQI